MSQIQNKIEKICKFAFNFSNMDTAFIDPMSQIKFEYGYTKVPEPLKQYMGNINDLLKLHESDSSHNVLFHSGSFKVNFISAKVYDGKDYLGSIVTGPYLLEEPTTIMIQNVIFENKLSISLSHVIKQYYLSLPLINTYKAGIIAEFLACISSDLSSINLDNADIGNISYSFQTESSSIHDIIKKNNEHSSDLIEERYRNENELLDTIKNGNKEKLEKLLTEKSSTFSKLADRIPNDPLRSRKNISFVANTLFRKAAEEGGLHPVYIDSISEKFAIQIEKSTSIRQLSDLYDNMARSYCDSVRKLSLKKFGYFIRKAVEFIRLNIDQELSLQNIADAINANPYELSRQFKKETGTTITEYINKQRITEAVRIIQNEGISVTDTAYMVGFNDVNYFTKVFKKIKGMTPSEYRKNRV